MEVKKPRVIIKGPGRPRLEDKGIGEKGKAATRDGRHRRRSRVLPFASVRVCVRFSVLIKKHRILRDAFPSPASGRPQPYRLQIACDNTTINFFFLCNNNHNVVDNNKCV